MINRVSKIENNVKVNNILLSVANKSGLDGFISELLKINPDIKFYSTGGTYGKIKELLGTDFSHNLISVSDYTGQPEMQGGLVKTLDFKIYLGLLSESDNDDHKKDMDRTDSIQFDMVVCNLYPFGETIKKEGVTLEDARANIDIGGPCMLRASAKNFLRVASVCDPTDYDEIIKEMTTHNGEITLEKRFYLAKKTFSHTSEYDDAISHFLMNDPDINVYQFK